MTAQDTFYKYKSLDNFEYLLDLLLKERLYAARYDELNDPMEGIAKIDGTIPEDKEQEWNELINRFRIVCFSRDQDNLLMWSHYADGARGCVVEFQLIDDQKVHKVSYNKKPMLTQNQITKEKAEEVLTYKRKPWKYELESRCLLDGNNHFLAIRIKSLTFGSRAAKEKVDLLQHILSLCKPDLKISVKSEQKLVNKLDYIWSNKRTYVRDSDGAKDICSKCSEVKLIQDGYIYKHRNSKDSNENNVSSKFHGLAKVTISDIANCISTDKP